MSSFHDIWRQRATHKTSISPITSTRDARQLFSLIRGFDDVMFDETFALMKNNHFSYIMKLIKSINDSKEEDVMSKITSVCKTASAVRKLLGDGPMNIPKVNWSDVGGLANAKHDIMQTISLSLNHPEIFKDGLIQRGGLLLYGPPGTGKTLLAKAIATECQLNFMSIKGPEVLNMYVGESEKNIREIFEKARENSPCVLFFDELDSLAPARGNGADSSSVMDRIVAQLLTEIDGLSKKGKLYVIGATNRLDLLDPALLRPGRFDKQIYLGISNEAKERIKIMKAQTRNFDVDEENISWEEIEKVVPKNFTGADFSGLTQEAYMIASREKITQIEEMMEEEKEKLGLTEEMQPEPFLRRKYGEEENGDLQRVEERIVEFQKILIGQTHFEEALTFVRPSLSEAEIETYKRSQQ